MSTFWRMKFPVHGLLSAVLLFETLVGCGGVSAPTLHDGAVPGPGFDLRLLTTDPTECAPERAGWVALGCGVPLTELERKADAQTFVKRDADGVVVVRTALGMTHVHRYRDGHWRLIAFREVSAAVDEREPRMMLTFEDNALWHRCEVRATTLECQQQPKEQPRVPSNAVSSESGRFVASGESGHFRIEDHVSEPPVTVLDINTRLSGEPTPTVDIGTIHEGPGGRVAIPWRAIRAWDPQNYGAYAAVFDGKSWKNVGRPIMISPTLTASSNLVFDAAGQLYLGQPSPVTGLRYIWKFTDDGFEPAAPLEIDGIVGGLRLAATPDGHIRALAGEATKSILDLTPDEKWKELLGGADGAVFEWTGDKPLLLKTTTNKEKERSVYLWERQLP